MKVMLNKGFSSNNQIINPTHPDVMAGVIGAGFPFGKQIGETSFEYAIGVASLKRAISCSSLPVLLNDSYFKFNYICLNLMAINLTN
jgi:hypothetical protein